MTEKSLLEGKRILAVDDEPDILETLEELLPMCVIVKASTADQAKKLMDSQSFDIAILDIMGVDGYELLEVANTKKIIAVILTAHALSVESTVKSFKGGADSYVPKEEISKIETFLRDILEAKKKGANSWWRWLDRFGAYYETKFGRGWQKDDKDFWRKFPSY